MLVTCDTSPLLSEEVFEQCYLILFPGQVTSTISKRDHVQEAGKTEVMGLSAAAPSLVMVSTVSYALCRELPPPSLMPESTVWPGKVQVTPWINLPSPVYSCTGLFLNT